MNLEIKQFTISDLSLLTDLRPDGWTDLTPSFNFYITAGYCYPIKLLKDNTMVGIGTAINFGDTSWIAHIIVHKNERGNGFGTMIVKYLIDYIQKNKTSTISLIATELGKPIYEKLGFRTDFEYAFYERDTQPQKEEVDNSLISYSNRFERNVLQLDKLVSSENRINLLLPHLSKSKLFISNDKLKSVYFPTLGEGMILAADKDSGKRILKYHASLNNKIVIPTCNTSANELLKESGFSIVRTAPRMYLGKKLNWQPKNYFSRIGGNLG